MLSWFRTSRQLAKDFQSTAAEATRNLRESTQALEGAVRTIEAQTDLITKLQNENIALREILDGPMEVRELVGAGWPKEDAERFANEKSHPA